MRLRRVESIVHPWGQVTAAETSQAALALAQRQMMEWDNAESRHCPLGWWFIYRDSTRPVLRRSHGHDGANQLC